MSDLKCPKCNADMDEGYLIDNRLPVRWVSGKPKRGFMGRLIESMGRDTRHVESRRCRACGFLELYAQDYCY